MSSTILIATLALFATASAAPYISPLSAAYYGAYGAPFGLPGAAVPAPVAPIAPVGPAAVAPVSAYSAFTELGAPAFAYNGVVPNYAPLSSAYVQQPAYGYAYGDAYYLRR